MKNKDFLRKKAMLTFRTLLLKIYFFNEFHSKKLYDEGYFSSIEYMKEMVGKKLQLTLIDNKENTNELVFDLKLVEASDYVEDTLISKDSLYSNIDKIIIKSKIKELIIDFNDDTLEKINKHKKISIRSNNISFTNNWILHSAIYKNAETKVFLKSANLYCIKKNLEKIKDLYFNKEIHPGIGKELMEFTELLYNEKSQVLFKRGVALNNEELATFYLKNYFTIFVHKEKSKLWKNKENLLYIQLVEKFLSSGGTETKTTLSNAQGNLIGYKNDFIDMNEIDFKMYKTFPDNLFKNNVFFSYITRPKYEKDFDIFCNDIKTMNIPIKNLLKISKKRFNTYSYSIMCNKLYEAAKNLGYIKNYTVTTNSDKDHHDNFIIVSYNEGNIEEQLLKKILNATLKECLLDENVQVESELRTQQLKHTLEDNEERKIVVKKKI